MNKKNKGILPKGYILNSKYTINFFLKKGDYAESYRVKDDADKMKFLKLIAFANLHRTQYNSDGNILEIEIAKNINHSSLIKYCEDGEIAYEGQKYAYLVLDFISGETVADKMSREETLNQYEAKDIIIDVLEGLDYLHTQNTPIIHNEITNLNVMMDLSQNIPKAKVIDFGYARFLSQSTKDFYTEGLNPFYMSPESFNNVFSVRSDIFSVGALYYHMLVGLPPWFVEMSNYKSDKEKLAELIDVERKKKLRISDPDIKVDEYTFKVIQKALAPKAENRFKSAKEFLQALNGEYDFESTPIATQKKEKIAVKKEVQAGKGFSAIAGMQELKDMITLDIIDALNDRERYEEYGLTIPNGMLLYGPPGCGKTFFAEKMAEEIGFNFFQIKPSDIQSKWVNASQENIKQLFDEARENAPSIIFIDELDALVPNRDDSGVHHMNSSVVNEFLAQMNNCGEDGLFVVGATNRPNSIDPAILRAGRLDKVIYLPPPDLEARRLMFKLHLEKRPIEVGFDYLALANATENFVSSDIKFLCDEGARTALKRKSRISKEIMLNVIRKNKPSISLSELKNYEVMKERWKVKK
ncbi:AAA family ATPase [Aureispira sp. CCB-E]|uniref:AAA family ATPase n=1 Tax=Aureispira sp. CCB-E TaxID=3051121 RepID=UPI0028685C47|nr:AAA family ATPase [Aureispira sp. CCB-E]WMX16516.1 AAA family ATPase [Aureispira sp. CCB-E]